MNADHWQGDLSSIDEDGTIVSKILLLKAGGPNAGRVLHICQCNDEDTENESLQRKERGKLVSVGGYHFTVRHRSSLKCSDTGDTGNVFHESALRLSKIEYHFLSDELFCRLWLDGLTSRARRLTTLNVDVEAALRPVAQVLKWFRTMLTKTPGTRLQNAFRLCPRLLVLSILSISSKLIEAWWV